MKKSVSIFLMLLIFGCGSKKKLLRVETSNKAVELTQINNITTNAKIHKTSKRTILTPIDESKPILIGDVVYQNAKVEIVDEVINEVVEEVDKSIVEKKATEKTRVKDLDLKVEKPNPWLWISITIIAIFGIYFFVKKPPTGGQMA